jgi:hypothetical protein
MCMYVCAFVCLRLRACVCICVFVYVCVRLAIRRQGEHSGSPTSLVKL